MKAVLQRVREASVTVDGEQIGRIGHGLLVLLCAERGDTDQQADRMLAKILKLRIFGDADDKMNRSVQDVRGGLLLVSFMMIYQDRMFALLHVFAFHAVVLSLFEKMRPNGGRWPTFWPRAGRFRLLIWPIKGLVMGWRPMPQPPG